MFFFFYQHLITSPLSPFTSGHMGGIPLHALHTHKKKKLYQRAKTAHAIMMWGNADALLLHSQLLASHHSSPCPRFLLLPSHITSRMSPHRVSVSLYSLNLLQGQYRSGSRPVTPPWLMLDVSKQARSSLLACTRLYSNRIASQFRDKISQPRVHNSLPPWRKELKHIHLFGIFTCILLLQSGI